MSGEARVLTGLIERRALEQAFAELGRTTEPAAVQQQAQTIAEYGTAALQHLLTLLDTPDPQLRGGLGQVARYLPRERVVSALRAVARAQDRSDQARLAAVTLLERFLEEPVDSGLIGNLGNPDVAARQSLRELVAAMDEEPLSVVEYLEQLAEQPADVVDMVLNALPAVEPSPHLATLLRMLAQGEDARVARRAIEELIRLRTPAALRALASLVPNLPPALAQSAERGLRKLRFSGVQERTDHDPVREPWYAPELRWRALISSVDAAGAQFMWFVGAEATGAASDREPAQRNRAVFFTIITQDPNGLRDASGSLQAAADHAPPRRREGAVHFIVGDGSTPGVTLLEAPFAMACRSLRESLALNWAAGKPTPIGYRLFSPLIWLAEEAQEAGLSALAPAEESWQATPEPDRDVGVVQLAEVLRQPAFHGWFRDVKKASLSPLAAASYARRFRAMSRWLAAAGDRETAALAATAAYHFENETPEASSILHAAIMAQTNDRGQELRDRSKESRNV